MSKPTLFVKGKLISHGSEPQGNLDQYEPIEYIMKWFETRLNASGPKDRILVLQSSTGSGKSTVLPPEFYHRFFEKTGRRNICCTQPRVLTSIEIPKQIVPWNSAETVGKGRTPLYLGDNIGYQNSVVAKKPTRGIIFMTIGTLQQQLKVMTDVEFMERYSIIFIDEAHERSVGTDLVLYMMKQLVQRNATNKDCPFLVIMSATFIPERFANYLLSDIGKKSERYENIMKVSGFTFPIEETWLDYDTTNYIQSAVDVAIGIHENNLDDVYNREELVAHGLASKGTKLKLDDDVLEERLKAQTFRDILIFVDGEGTAKKIIRKLAEMNSTREAFIAYPIIPIKLMGVDVSTRTENYINITKPMDKMGVEVRVGGKVSVKKPVRRIIVASNVAETGITIDTLKYVVDTGYNKSSEYNPIYRTELLVTKPVAKSMYTQRRGRAGRKAPGFAFPLYTKAVFEALQDDQHPDIIKEDTVLDCLNLLIMNCDGTGSYNLKSVHELIVVEGPKKTSVDSLSKVDKIKRVRKLIEQKALQNLVTDMEGPSDGPGEARAQLAGGAPFTTDKSANLRKRRTSSQLRAGLARPSDYEIGLMSTRVNLWNLDLIDLPSADSMHSSVERLFYAGAINANSTPTAVGVLMNKFRFLGIECVRMILAGFAWNAPIMDLITAAAIIGGGNLFDERSDKFSREGVAKLITGDADESLWRSTLAMSCDILEKIVIWYRYQDLCVGALEGEAVDTDAWCESNAIQSSVLEEITSSREDIIQTMATIGLNPYSWFEKSYKTRTDDWIRVMKQCFYEGFKTNIAIWNPVARKYETMFGKLALAIDRPWLMSLGDLSKYQTQNPKYILYTDIIYRQDFKTNEYISAIGNVSVLDGYVSIDL